MPRLPRVCLPDYPVHVVQRGNNRQPCFVVESDKVVFAYWLREGALRYEVEIHAWVFMTNHVHLLLTPRHSHSVARLVQFVSSHYVRYFNAQHARSGTLFQGRYKSSVVQDDRYLLNCLRYIELNPVRGGMVRDPSDYSWSSFQAHAFGLPMKMWTPHPLYLELGRTASERQRNYRSLASEALEADTLNDIRQCAHRGRVLGDANFRAQVAEQVACSDPGV